MEYLFGIGGIFLVVLGLLGLIVASEAYRPSEIFGGIALGIALIVVGFVFCNIANAYGAEEEARKELMINKIVVEAI